MSLLTTADMEALRTCQTGGMHDWCVVQSFAESQDSTSGQVSHVFTDGLPVACGFDPGGGRELRELDKTTTVTFAMLRLPWGTTVEERDRIKLLTRSGETLSTPVVYRISAPPQRGITGVLLQLDIVEP